MNATPPNVLDLTGFGRTPEGREFGEHGSSAVGCGGIPLRGSGQIESTAFFAVRHDTLHLRSSSPIFIPAW